MNISSTWMKTIEKQMMKYLQNIFIIMDLILR